MIEEVKYKDFFINLHDIPEKGTPERKALRERERNRCLGGVTVDGVFISGWLYWHTNHWWIRDDILDEYNNIVPVEAVASLRDNEWIRAEALEKCRVGDDGGCLGYIEVGLRQGGKSTFESSITAYNATLFNGSQNVVVGGNADDLKTIGIRMDFGFDKLHEILKVPKLTQDVRSKMVILGYKEQGTNENKIHSYIAIRNIADGKNTEGPAGLSAKSFIMDEIGKYSFSQAYEAAKPSFISKFGQRATPILVGTGGAFEKGQDAERVFYHPEANRFLAFTDPDTGKNTGLFMSGLYRTDCKYKTNLAAYLIAEKKIPEGDYPELSKIPIYVANKEKALALILRNRELKANDPDQTEYLKQIMYFPLNPKECFLSSSENFYNSNLAKQQKERLEVQFPGLRIGMFVELSDEGEKITHKPSVLNPITTYPCIATEDKNTPIVILEHPIPNPPWGLYVFGVDPYRFERADNSDSLGACYIFKRMYDVQGDSFQDMPVAWYVGRPDSKESWNNNVRLLIKYYNATGLCENDEMSFIDYMISKGDGHHLMDTPDWLKEFIPTSSTVQRAKGISSANQKVKELLRTNLKQYMEEVFQTIPVPGTTETKKLLGISRIYDPMFLEEIVKWNKDGNFDREIALSLAITCARKMDAQKYKVDVQETDPRFKKPDIKKMRQGRGVFKEIGVSYSYRATSSDRISRLMK